MWAFVLHEIGEAEDTRASTQLPAVRDTVRAAWVIHRDVAATRRDGRFNHNGRLIGARMYHAFVLQRINALV